MRRARLAVLTVLLVIGLLEVTPEPARAGVPPAEPTLTVEVLQSGLQLPWGLDFLPDGTMLFTERPGTWSVLGPEDYTGTPTELTFNRSDLYVNRETGLLDLLVDPAFATNRRVFTCQGRTGGSQQPRIQVISWRLDAGLTQATRIRNPLVDWVTQYGPQQGRHGGCRLRFDALGNLYVATGDGANTGNPQNLGRLGGKVLRVNPDTGAGVRGNPWFQNRNANRRRIWNYGHRNLQGLALRPGTQAQFWTAEHGTFRDDEVNLVLRGRNYGWQPGPGYDESPPMTNHSRFPNAIDAVWSSGIPTIATSGAVFLEGSQWGSWDGALAVACLAGQQLKVFTLDGNAVDQELTPAALDQTFGRLRTPVLGPDGNLYLTTSNGAGTDQILRVTPS